MEEHCESLRDSKEIVLTYSRVSFFSPSVEHALKISIDFFKIGNFYVLFLLRFLLFTHLRSMTSELMSFSSSLGKSDVYPRSSGGKSSPHTLDKDFHGLSVTLGMGPGDCPLDIVLGWMTG